MAPAESSVESTPELYVPACREWEIARLKKGGLAVEPVASPVRVRQPGTSRD